jgi:hypothetical protein
MKANGLLKKNPMFLRKGCIVQIATLVLGCFALAAAEPEAKVQPQVAPQWQPRLPLTDANNLIPNSGFELGTSGWSSLGEVTPWSGNLSTLFGKITSADKYEGEHSLEIALGPGKTPVIYDDSMPAASAEQLAPLAVNLGWVTVKAGETYTLSAYMKASRPGVPARLVMRFGGKILPKPEPKNWEKTVTLTKEWARYSFTARAADTSVCVGLGPDLRAQPDGAATVWIDAVQLERGARASNYAPRAPVEIAIGSGRLGNVYAADAPVSIKIAVANQSQRAAKLEVTLSLLDYFDKTLPQTPQSLTAHAGATIAQEIPLAIPGPGFYRLVASVATSDGLKQETNFPLAVIYEYGKPDSPFGVNNPPATPDLLNEYREAGVLWGRNWSADWYEVEPRQNFFDWDQSDKYIGRLKEAGWQVLSLLPALPSTKWSSELPQDFVIPPQWNAPPEWAWWSAAPKDPALVANYIRKTVSRYKDRINHWEFLNEPGTSTALPSPYRGMPGYRYDAQTYLDLLKVASKALKETDPSAKMVGGFGLEVLFRAPQFIRAGGLNYIDILNIHPYGFFEDQPEQFIPQMEALLSLMDASKAGRKPIWVTESGYYGKDDKPWLPWVAPPDDFAANVLLKNEKMAADYTMRHALIMLSHGVEKIFYHQGSSGDVNNGRIDMENYLVGPQGVPKKVYPALSYLAHLLGSDFKYVGPMAKPAEINGLTTDSIYGYAFQSGAKAVLAAWAPTEWQRGYVWTLKVPRDVDAFNIVGTKLTVGGNGERVVLGDSPVYLVTDLMPAGDLAQAQMLRVSLQEGKQPSAPATVF